MADSSNDGFKGLVVTAVDNRRCTISMRAIDTAPSVSLLYSVDDGISWEPFYVNRTQVVLEPGEHAYFRGAANGINKDGLGSAYGYNLFEFGSYVALSGNINSLLSYDDFDDIESVPPYCFYGLFHGGPVKDVSGLILPSLYVGAYAYGEMFYECSFRNPPTISAISLGEGCFYKMFFRVTSLEVAPDLPATTLAKDCYKMMFYACSLREAPTLPATHLVDGCYSQMFYGVDTLRYIEVGFKEWGPDSATEWWLDGVQSSGVFVCRESLPIEFGHGRIPGSASASSDKAVAQANGWTVDQTYCSEVAHAPSGPCAKEDPDSDECRYIWDDSKCHDTGCGFKDETYFAINCGPCETDEQFECGEVVGGGDEPCRYDCASCGDPGCGKVVGGDQDPCRISCDTDDCEGPCGEVPTGGGSDPCVRSTYNADEKCSETGGFPTRPGECDCPDGKEWKDCDTGCVCTDIDCGPCGTINPETCKCEWDDAKCPDLGPCGKKDCDGYWVEHAGLSGCYIVPVDDYNYGACGMPSCVTGPSGDPCYVTDYPGFVNYGPCGAPDTNGGVGPCRVVGDSDRCDTGPCGSFVGEGDGPVSVQWDDSKCPDTGCGEPQCSEDGTGDCVIACEPCPEDPTGCGIWIGGGSGPCSMSCHDCDPARVWDESEGACVCDPDQPHEDYCACYYPAKSGLEYCTCMYLTEPYVDYDKYCACTYGEGTPEYCDCRRILDSEYDYCGCMHELDPDTYRTECKRDGSLTPECSCDCSTAVPCDNDAEFDSECGCDCSTASVGPDFCKNGAGWDTEDCRCDCSTASVHEGDCIYGFWSEGECACVCDYDKLNACMESGGTWIPEICRCDCGDRCTDSDGYCRCCDPCPDHMKHIGYTCDCECDVPVGSVCTVAEGDCTGHSGTIQSDCSCAIVCPGDTHPGDDCVSAAALTSNGRRLNCDCECEGTCTPGDPCTASHGVPGHYSQECVCMPDCTPDTKCPDGIHVYDQNCDCVCENTGACTVDVGDCRDVPGHINGDTCACDPDCTPGSGECTYTDAEGNVGDGVKDCQCDCTCKKDGGSCAYDNTRPGRWTDDCTCICDDVGANCEFVDEKGSHGFGNIGDDCSCHCVVGGGCVYMYEGHPVNGTFSSDCVCGCDDSGKEECIASGKGWDHLRCHCGCKDSDRDACTNKGPHWTWTEEDCTCRCDMEAEMKPKCEQEPSHGSWITESCACTCPEAKTLVEGECFCGGSKEEEDRNEEACKAVGGIEYDRMTCKCNCGDDKEWDPTNKKCVCKNLAEETEACNKLGFIYNDKDCKCSDCRIEETTKEVELCSTSPDPVDFDFDECKCKCKDVHRVRELTEEGVMLCSCDDDYYRKEKRDCNSPAKQNAGWTWVKDDCECKCTDWETKTCLIGDYPNGKRDSKCNCYCPPEARLDTSCGEHQFYNSECKCDCVIGDKCTINPDIVDDGRMAKDENGRCYCKCNGGGEPCSITDKHTGQEITGLTTGPDCYCKCGDKIGTPCEWTEGDPSSGVLWDDCQCKCLEYHQFCTTDTIPYGQYDDNCECACAPAGTKCLAADGTVGKVVNDGKGTCACECDYEKEARDCENKQINDGVRKDGNPKTWEFSVNGCECKCADAGFDCWYENSEGELVPGKINADTCDCEDCEITSVTCLDPATANVADCNCECKGEGVPECEYGKHNVYGMMPPCACACDNDVDEEYCSMQPHQGTAKDYLIPGEHCDCVCANAKAECVMDSGEKGYKRESDCKCVCGLTAETAGCNDSQDFDPDQCKCVCKKDLDDCRVGERTWKPTEETKCLCTCDDVHDCKNSGNWLEYDEEGGGCKCDCSDAELPADHKWYESEYVKFTDYDCTEYCTLTPSGCDQPGSYDPEHCDCRKCLRLQEEGCTGATPDYYEDESGCGCWCDEKLHKKPSCKEFDPWSCSCKKECINYDQEEVDRRALCDTWDWDTCSFIPRPDSPWFGSRDVVQSELDKAITSLSALIANLVVPAYPPDVTICPCAQYFYKPDGHTVTGDCSSPALKERVDDLKSEYSRLYKLVANYHDAYTSCKQQTETRKYINSKLECGAQLMTVPSCVTDEDKKKRAMTHLEDLRRVQTSISNISSSLSGYCTGGNTCKECEPGGGGGGGGGGGDPDPEPTCSGERYDASSYCDKYEADSDECYDCLLAKCYAVADTEGLMGYCACVYGSESPEFLACYYSGGDYDRRYGPEDDPEDYPDTDGDEDYPEEPYQ